MHVSSLRRTALNSAAALAQVQIIIVLHVDPRIAAVAFITSLVFHFPPFLARAPHQRPEAVSLIPGRDDNLVRRLLRRIRRRFPLQVGQRLSELLQHSSCKEIAISHGFAAATSIKGSYPVRRVGPRRRRSHDWALRPTWPSRKCRHCCGVLRQRWRNYPPACGCRSGHCPR